MFLADVTRSYSCIFFRKARAPRPTAKAPTGKGRNEGSAPLPHGAGRLKELVARKALKGGGDLEKREAEKNQIKSSAFVNLHLVINGPNEFAKDHQAQTYRPSAGS